MFLSQNLLLAFQISNLKAKKCIQILPGTVYLLEKRFCQNSQLQTDPTNDIKTLLTQAKFKPLTRT